MIRGQFPQIWIDIHNTSVQVKFDTNPIIFQDFMATLNFCHNRDLTDNPETIGNRSKAVYRHTQKISQNVRPFQGLKVIKTRRKKSTLKKDIQFFLIGGGGASAPLTLGRVNCGCI